ncbi:uncharacterized protein LOC126673186 [Mercurialis annua]|uniref:uncharacterized protein LOC126673186 n=1 Tax=Mercurialis annua TaxID=3986 RepID=UPI00215F96FC|nr:uncharacterized protein LOC126673186 [Mercurialis annua]
MSGHNWCLNGDMALAHRTKKETSRTGFKKPSKGVILSGTSLASVESLSVPLVQEVVLSADMQCVECQKRVAEFISRMNDTESVLINVLEKKVTLTCRYPALKLSTAQLAGIYSSPLKKIAVVKRIFRSVCT